MFLSMYQVTLFNLSVYQLLFHSCSFMLRSLLVGYGKSEFPTCKSCSPDQFSREGVRLAQMVKASVGQADVQRFESHLRHNWLSFRVFLVKCRHFGLHLAQTLSGWLGRYTNVEYLQILYLKRRGQLLFPV